VLHDEGQSYKEVTETQKKKEGLGHFSVTDVSLEIFQMPPA
jgi:hypothetical protein